MKIINKEPDNSIVKQVVCMNCGVKIEYVPIDVVTLWSGTDMGGGSDGASGFKCPNLKCGKNIILKQW